VVTRRTSMSYGNACGRHAKREVHTGRKDSIWGLPLTALSVRVSVPERAPLAVGVKVTLTLQCWPGRQCSVCIIRFCAKFSAGNDALDAHCCGHHCWSALSCCEELGRGDPLNAKVRLVGEKRRDGTLSPCPTENEEGVLCALLLSVSVPVRVLHHRYKDNAEPCKCHRRRGRRQLFVCAKRFQMW